MSGIFVSIFHGRFSIRGQNTPGKQTQIVENKAVSNRNRPNEADSLEFL